MAHIVSGFQCILFVHGEDNNSFMPVSFACGEKQPNPNSEIFALLHHSKVYFETIIASDEERCVNSHGCISTAILLYVDFSQLSLVRWYFSRVYKQLETPWLE
jgi:hypothetical protein